MFDVLMLMMSASTLVEDSAVLLLAVPRASSDECRPLPSSPGLNLRLYNYTCISLNWSTGDGSNGLANSAASYEHFLYISSPSQVSSFNITVSDAFVIVNV